jgi:hypothetical protein
MDGFDYWANSDGIARIAEDCQRIQIEHIASKFVVFRFSIFNVWQFWHWWQLAVLIERLV